MLSGWEVNPSFTLKHLTILIHQLWPSILSIHNGGPTLFLCHCHVLQWRCHVQGNLKFNPKCWMLKNTYSAFFNNNFCLALLHKRPDSLLACPIILGSRPCILFPFLDNNLKSNLWNIQGLIFYNITQI